jgi:hypothetical protein
VLDLCVCVCGRSSLDELTVVSLFLSACLLYISVLLAFYSEDVMRTVEREVRKSEALIRTKYPGAEYIELEPMSVDVDRLAIDDNLEAELRRVEGEELDRFLHTLRAESKALDEAESKLEKSKKDGTATGTEEKPL